MTVSVSSSSPLWRGLRGYALAVAATLLALLLTWLCLPLLGLNLFLFFFAAITVSAWYGGWGPGLLATLLALSSANPFTPSNLLSLQPDNLLRVGVFSFVTVLIGTLTAARRRAAAAAFLQSERYRVTLTSIGDAVIVTDVAGRVTLMNAVAEQLTGWRLPEAQGRASAGVFAIVNEHTREPVGSPIERVIREGVVVGLANHTLLLARDGSERPIADSGAPICDTSGELIGAVLVFRDVSEQREAARVQAQLLERTAAAREEAEAARAQVAAILASITDGFLAFDRSWRFTYANDAGARTLGRPPAALLGTTLWEEFPELADTSFGQLYRRALAEQTPLELEDYYPPFQSWFAVRAYPSAAGLALYFRDVSERRRVQEALAQSEDRYRVFIAQSSEGIWRFELEQPLDIALPADVQLDHCYAHGYLAECNDAMARMYGFARAEEIVGARLGDLLVRADPQNEAYLRAFIQSGYHLSDAESRERDRYGNERSFSNNLVGIVEAGRLLRAWGTQRDITDRRAAEVARERALAEAERALQLRDQFLLVAAHELRTPITSLAGFTQVLLRRTRRDLQLPQRDQRALEVIDAQTARLNTLVEDLLNITRLQGGQFTIERAPIDVAALLERIVETVRPSLDGHTLTLVGADAPTLVQGDALRLEQVMQNLIQNAIKYSPDGGQISVSLTRDARNAAIAVTDQGIGIPSDALAQLFNRFFRASNADTRGVAGLGIGLYVVKEIVARHDGHVSVASAEGVGSTFTVTLPLLPLP